MFKLDIEPISYSHKNNRDTHENYLKKTIENIDTIRGLVKHARKQNPSEPLLDSACVVYVSKTCPSLTKSSEKFVAVTPKNKNKKVRFADPITSSNNTQKQVDSHKNRDSNQPLLHSTREICCTSASGSKPTCNTKNNRISQSSRSYKTNKVEDQSRSVKSRKNKKTRVAKTKCNAYVMQSMLNANYNPVCVICNECLFDANHDKCVLNFVQDVNVHSKSISTKNKKKQNNWKPTGKVFTEIGYRWKPIGRTFTLVGNSCPLTRITSTKVVHLKETTSKSVETQKLKIKVYNKKPKPINYVGNHSQLINFVSKCLGTVRFGNDKIAKIMGYEDYQLGNIIISQAEAIATACYTQNRSLIRKHHNKTPYELLYNKKPDLSYLYVFGALCYPTNDSEDIGKLQPKAYIRIFVGYARAKKAFQIYNQRTRLIIETIHVTFVPVVVALVHADSIGIPSSTLVDQDVPSPSTSQTPQET
nr:retrovirus-related Pol polyprotein from transposon TNT 1-94 [Tanacetum cinerariifolium]